MAEARSPDLPPHLTFRSQSGIGRCQEQHGKILIEAPEWALQPQLRVAVKVRFLIPRRALLPVRAQASFRASVFRLLFVPIRICQFFWLFLRFLSHAISSSPLSVSVSVCAAALIWVKWWARASPAAWPMALSFLFRQIFFLFSLTWRLLVLQRGSEFSLVLERMRRVTRLCPIYRPGFVVLQ
jgi:hypothetical protein